jgi:serine protease Do
LVEVNDKVVGGLMWREWEAVMMTRVIGIFSALVTVGGIVHAGDLTPREIYEKASPAVVFVMGHPSSGTKGSGGTGSVVQASGLVLTNAHVVIDERTSQPFHRINVYIKPVRVTGDPKTDLAKGYRARVLSYSQPLDLALLKLDGSPEELAVVELSESDRTQIGDRVVAIGHPEQGGLWTLTTGVISAEFENFNGVSGKHVFQTETGLNRGNSGGPLLDGQGRMIGVNTAIARVAPDGLPITSISFSLKSSVAKKWLREQGVSSTTAAAAMPAPPMSQTPAADASPPPPPPAPVAPAQTPKAPIPPLAQAQAAPPARPYNLDQLISERAKAEADLEEMMRDMRGKFQGR